jgi:hypothetical protein
MRLEYKEREERIKDMKATGMPLSKLDKMKENSSAFWKLNDVQRE